MTIPNQTKPDQTKPNQTKPKQTKPNQINKRDSPLHARSRSKYHACLDGDQHEGGKCSMLSQHTPKDRCPPMSKPATRHVHSHSMKHSQCACLVLRSNTCDIHFTTAEFECTSCACSHCKATPPPPYPPYTMATRRETLVESTFSILRSSSFA